MLFDFSTGAKITGGGVLKRRLLAKVRPSFKIKSETEFKWCRFLGPVPACAVEDEDIRGLYRIPLAELHKVPSTDVIVQDKASCFPVAALRIKRPRAHAVDACSAPGNKTLQLASRVAHVTAYERDPRRFEVLHKRLKAYGVTNVTPYNEDFLAAKLPPKTKYIVVDPSCSGSGIVEHQLIDSGKLHYDSHYDDRRVQGLCKMQLSILRRALSVPGVSQVVYSTCSVYIQENEAVVKAALAEFSHKFRLMKALPQWPQRGLPYLDVDSEKLVRVHPGSMTGFFVALFGRRGLRLRHKLLGRRRILQ
jgi:putative methyltransferase